MKRGLDVLVVGSLHLDIVVKASHMPALDETVRGTAWQKACGGKGGNQACWSARFGAKTAMISRIGKDDFGETLLANLKSCGVNTRAIGVAAKTGSGMSVAILNKDGEYGAVIVSGSNLAMTRQQVVKDMRKLGPAKLMVLQNEVSEDVNLAAAREAKKHETMIVLNAAPTRKVAPALARLVDVLIVNRVEAAMLAGTKDAVAAVPKLLKLCSAVIVTLGASGLIVAQRGMAQTAIAPHKVKVRSAHGAGDCFVARLAASLAKGENLLEAARKANKSAATFVSGKRPR